MSLVNLYPTLIKNSLLPGYDVVSSSDLTKFVDGNTSASGVVISGSVSIEIDLFRRYELSEIRYYYTGNSEVEIFVSKEGTSWESVSYSDESGYASVSGTFSDTEFSSWPKALRINHTKNSGDVYGYEVQITGSDTGFTYPQEEGPSNIIDTDVSAESEVTPFLISNNSGASRDINCFLDTTSSSSYSGVALSTSSSGTFYIAHSRGLRMPRDYAWNLGTFTDTVVSGSVVVTDPSSNTGYYYTPVFDIESFVASRIYFEYTNISGSYIDWDDSQLDSGYTIGVRLYNIVPEAPWVNGTMPSVTDSYWKTDGSLDFVSISSDQIIGEKIGRAKYFQAAIKFTTPILESSSELIAVGIEEALTSSGIQNGSSANMYIRTNIDSLSSGSGANILTFFLE
jgi:hypothetical protein